MTDFKEGDEVWFFEFIDSDKIMPLEFEDLQLCCERTKYIDEYSLQNCIIGKSKNEAIDALIKQLEAMRDE